MKTTIFLLCALAPFSVGHVFSQTLPSRLESLTENYERAIERATAPIERKYVEELKQLKQDLSKKGDLKGALEVDVVLERLAREQSKLGSMLIEKKWNYYNPTHKLTASIDFHADGTATVTGQMSGTWVWRVVGENRLEMGDRKVGEVVFEFKDLRKLDVDGKHTSTGNLRVLSRFEVRQ